MGWLGRVLNLKYESQSNLRDKKERDYVAEFKHEMRKRDDLIDFLIEKNKFSDSILDDFVKRK